MEIDKNELLVGKAFEELTFEEMALSQGTGELTRKAYTTLLQQHLNVYFLLLV